MVAGGDGSVDEGSGRIGRACKLDNDNVAVVCAVLFVEAYLRNVLLIAPTEIEILCQHLSCPKL
jgi:hypothetical protein